MDEAEELKAENARLKDEVVRLERRVEELDGLAHTDALCPLPNRRGFIRALERALARHERYGEKAALLYVDMDRLKDINDAHGHAVGDAALVELAEALIAGTRTNDTVARIGGDEFCVLLERAGHGQACDTAARLIESVEGRAIEELDEKVGLSIAIGITCIEKGDSPDDALARADAAMYRAKRAEGADMVDAANC